MPSYIKRGSGWRAQICCKGIRQTKTFPTKGAAQAWATNLEHEIQTGKARYATHNLLDDALLRYLEENVPQHRGARRERNFIGVLRRHEIALKPLSLITASDIAKWRDDRLKSVCSASVRREMVILSAVFSVAKKEWGWVSESPLSKVKKPQSSPPRNRRISVAEIAAIVAELTTESGQTVALMFRLALQTAMRQGEICGIRARHVMGSYVHLPITKNGSARDVPLTAEAQQIVAELVNRRPLRPDNVSQIFRQAVNRAGIKDLRFHDARHEAAVFLSSKVDVMDLAKIGGWKSLGILLNTYYAPTPDDLAAKLR